MNGDVNADDEVGDTSLHLALMKRASISSEINELEAPTIYGVSYMYSEIYIVKLKITYIILVTSVKLYSAIYNRKLSIEKWARNTFICEKEFCLAEPRHWI